jgi:predicted transcriptional regulator
MRRYSKCESEILDALYKMEQGAVSDVVKALGGARSYEAVRTTLRVLKAKGAVSRRLDDRRHIYAPTLASDKAWQRMARQLADVFFGGSLERAALAMLQDSGAQIPADDLRRVEKRVAEWEAAKKSKRKSRR